MRARLLATAAIAALAVPVFAAAGASADPGANNCFGQGRAAYAVNGPTTVGFYASMRAGTNAAINHAYMDSCGK